MMKRLAFLSCYVPKLNLRLVVMKPAKNRVRTDDSGPLNGERDRSIFIQWPLRPDVVVIASVGSQNAAYMRFTEDNEMVQALAPD